MTQSTTLESLTLRTSLAEPLDWSSSFDRLESLHVSAARVRDLSHLPLTRLALVEHRSDDLESTQWPTTIRDLAITGHLRNVNGVHRLPRLETLRIDSPSLADLNDLAGLDALTELVLARLRWQDLQAIPATVLVRLTQLLLVDSAALADLSALAEAGSLRRLCLLNTKHVASLAPLRACRALQRLDLLGTTSIADGDLQILQELPSLTWVQARPRRHYNLTREELGRWGDQTATSDLPDADFP